MKKENKKNIIVFSSMILCAILICFSFIREHFSLDTYFTYVSGYEVYAKWFLKSARVITSLIWNIAGILNIPKGIFITVNGALCVITLSISAFIIYKTLDKLLNNNNNNLKSILIAILSFIFIFNPMLLQNLVYAENFVMSIAVLSSCIAASYIIKEENITNKFIFPIILLLITTFGYQGLINVYVIFAMILITIKYSEDIKKYIFKIINMTINYVIALGTNFVILKLINKVMFFGEIDRANGKIDLLYNISYPFIKLKTVLIDTCGMMPKNMFCIIIIIALVTLMYSIYKNKPNIKRLFTGMLLAVGSYMICFIPMLALQKESLDASARLLFGVGAIPAVLIFLSMFYNKKNSTVVNDTITVSLVVILILFSINYIRVGKEHIMTNSVDLKETRQICDIINEYENNNNIKITNIVSGKDKNPSSYVNDKVLKNELTVRVNYVDWTENILLTKEMNREFKQRSMTEEEKKTYFNNKEYDSFSKEQIVFVDDTMYWYKY